MDDRQNVVSPGRLGEAETVSIPIAARRLGLDPYTLYTLVQRERVKAGLSASGEFVIANAELNRLLKKD